LLQQSLLSLLPLLTNRDEVTNAGLGVYRETPLQALYSDSDQQQQQQQQQHSETGLAMAAAQFGRGASAGHTTNTNTSTANTSTANTSTSSGGAATLDPTTAASLLQQLALRRAQSSSPPKAV
jgi:hypothetical protein